MSDNFGKSVLLIVAAFIGIILFVYLGLPLLKIIILFLIQIAKWIAVLLCGFVRFVIIVTVAVATIIVIITFFRWLFEQKPIS